MGYTRFGRVYAGSTQLLLGYILTCYGFYDFRASQEHVAGTTCHDVEVCQSRRINGSTGARAEDTGNLGNNTGSQDVTLENLSVSCQGIYSFLDTSSTGVVQTDNGSAHLHGLIHYFTDLHSQSLRQGSTEYGEILSEDIYQTSVDRTITCYDTIA